MMKSLLGLVLVGTLAALSYVASDPLRARVDGLLEQATEWTPENMAQDPVGYLRWALTELDAIELSLQARQIEQLQLQGGVMRKRQAERRIQSRYTSELAQLKACYPAAGLADEWPVSFQATSLDETEFRRRVLECDTRMRGSEANLAHFDEVLVEVGDNIRTVNHKLAEVQDRRREITTQLEHLKLDLAVADLGSLSDRIDALLDSARAVATVRNGDRERVLEGERETDQRRFEEIMGLTATGGVQ